MNFTTHSFIFNATVFSLKNDLRSILKRVLKKIKLHIQPINAKISIQFHLEIKKY